MFRARVNFARSFVTAPQVWLRWADSDGINTRYKVDNGDFVAFYDLFGKDLRVVSVDQTGFVYEGAYWLAEFYNNAW